MTPSEQLHHATGVLSCVWTLRVALNEPARLLPKEADMAKPWRCRIRLHRWQRLRNPEGGWFRECRDCGEQQDASGSPPSMAGAHVAGWENDHHESLGAALLGDHVLVLRLLLVLAWRTVGVRGGRAC
jgi:hypothetical protein